VVGAQLIAAGRSEAAVQSLTTAVTKFRAAKKSEYTLMAEGYIGIARTLVNSTRDAGKKDLQSAVDALLENGSPDAKFFAGQLRTAAKVFSK